MRMVNCHSQLLLNVSNAGDPSTQVSPAAVADAHANAAANDIGNAAFQQADLDQGMPAGMLSPDVVVAGKGAERPVLKGALPVGMAGDLA